MFVIQSGMTWAQKNDDKKVEQMQSKKIKIPLS